MIASELSAVQQDYLKIIYSVAEWSDDPVTTTRLADRLGVVSSTVSETIRRLDADGLVTHARYGPVELTPDGRVLALEMVRRHRLIETYLVSELGYTWDEVHDEAEALEHVVTDRMLARMDERLGFPTRDPHGDPIPDPTGAVQQPPARRLDTLQDGAGGVVARISDADPNLLRYLAESTIGLDSRVEVRERRSFAGTLTVAVSKPGRTRLGPDFELGERAAGSIWVV